MDHVEKDKPAPLFTIGINRNLLASASAEISSTGIAINGCDEYVEGLAKLAASMAPYILDREERRQMRDANPIENARAALMAALSFGSDEDREHAEDAVENLVAFIGGEEYAMQLRGEDARQSDPIAEAIKAHWGPRCADSYAGCACCDAWAAYDALVDRPVHTGTAQEPVIVR